eukprot:CAMPEP_0119145454 /NCGR_PEP_ID=MMETSP1310-20130426/37560_1 /TAXON_ID=464262 /ORGANISM="Genus nov. species nov., Strain RCC2339" /LENGTH=38 /DNA_ID= /DNA_START= /DNA_END= /DNA_ORIENTATION=
MRCKDAGVAVSRGGGGKVDAARREAEDVAKQIAVEETE